MTWLFAVNKVRFSHINAQIKALNQSKVALNQTSKLQVFFYIYNQIKVPKKMYQLDFEVHIYEEI